MLNYRAPRWMPGGHAQTIWPALWSRRTSGPLPPFKRERWATPDGDFVDVDFLSASTPAAPSTPLLVLFHGLEGSSRSHYAQAFACAVHERGWHFALPHFRGCSGEPNRAPRAYHSGDHEEIAWLLRRMKTVTSGPVLAVGVSLGGNALLRWAGEEGSLAAQQVKAVASVSAPLDLAAGGAALGRGFNRWVYTRMFLRTLKPKALHKLQQFPGLFDREQLLAARDLYEFDNVFTAPIHGFKNTEDYWRRASSKPHLLHMGVPALVINARNDPFVPAHSLPTPREVSPLVTLWQPPHGGHVGFAQGRPPGEVLGLPNRVLDWLGKWI